MEIAFGIFGGIGLFVLGMTLMTDGLKDFAGDYLRVALLKFTYPSWKAFLSGAFATAMVQSSSATTVMVISFVSAGLMSFTQALGVVIGASLGTTATSWIVAWVGLKINVGLYALPLLGLGAFARILGKGRWRSLGISLAGFALIFVGIQTLQDGMSGLTDAVDISTIAGGGWVGTLLAILLGIMMTVLMQSSSAATATALTALGTDAIRFDQAAAVVIGASIGTTITAALASIGGSTPARRTALGHILFNLATGVIAIFLFPLLLGLVAYLQEQFDRSADATGLALFHTLFVGIGALIFLPFTDRFAKLIERLIPELGSPLTRHLDRSLTETPAVALAASQLALTATAQQVANQLLEGIKDGKWSLSHLETSAAIEEIKDFLGSLRAVPDDPVLSQYRVSQLHALDHLMRLESRLAPKSQVRQVLKEDALRENVQNVIELLEYTQRGLTGPLDENWVKNVQQLAKKLNDARNQQRPRFLQQTAQGGLRSGKAIDLLDGSRYLERIAYHIYRCCVHLRSQEAADSSYTPPQESTEA